MIAYEDFLHSKVKLAEVLGFEVSEEEINAALMPHQRAMVKWSVLGGRRAVFAAFGLGKTVIELECARLIALRTSGRALIVIPLGVRQEFIRDSQEILGWATTPTFIRSIAEASATGIYLTNYETVRDGKLDPAEFNAVILDEASVLRGFGGTKTFREMMRLCTGDGGPSGNHRKDGKTVPFRIVATATPAPNEYIELLAYSEFLGVMDISQAKTRFFKRDSTKADNLTLHAHKEREFWLWVSSWAIFVQKPSDLGFPDDGYELPHIDIRWHQVGTDHSAAGVERSGQSKLFRDAAIGVQDAASEKRSSLSARIAKLMEIRGEDLSAHRIIWHDLEAEREAIEDALPIRRWNHWRQFKDGNPAALGLYSRHYSARAMPDGDDRKLFCGPGSKLVLLTDGADALFAWRKFIDDSGQIGVNCAVFRNEGPTLASDLILEAMAIAWQRWPGERLYTYVDADEIKSGNPGCCFKMAGWTQCGVSKGGLLVFEALPGHLGLGLSAIEGCRSVYGSQDLEEREQAIIDFSDGKFEELAAKPCIAGSGCNFQRHCAWAVFLGIGFKFNDFIQAVHRIQRFLQKRPVRIDLIYTEAEQGIRKVLEGKWRAHNEMVKQMSGIIKEFGLSAAATAHSLHRKMGTERVEVTGDGYRLVNNDTVIETRGLQGNSQGLIVTSVPFSTQYEYSPNYADFGHSEGNAEFFSQMDFLTPEMLRVLQPGRIAAVHVKDRIVPGGMTGLGFQTVYPFHCRCIEHYMKHGFAYMGMITVVTDVVRENNQTYRLSWTEQCKDATKMGVGMPEYVLLFRKPPTETVNSYADVPVVKSKADYTLSRWQIDAHAFWRSSGNRLITPEELKDMTHAEIFRAFRAFSYSQVYDFEHHVKLGASLAAEQRLPTTFMILQPQSQDEDVWSDITRMRSLNSLQHQKGAQMHLCPLQFDIVDRLINRFSMPGESVFDPFAGLMTVPYRALLAGRRGLGFELNAQYFNDGAFYCRGAAEKMALPDLFAIPEEQLEEILA